MNDAPPVIVTDNRPVILVVEDEWIVRLVLADALRDAGHTVMEAVNGAEAIAFIDSGAPLDMIITDVRMPGAVDGLALLAFAQSEAPGIPVIISSGHLDPTIAMRAGAAGFLQKPYSVMDATALVDATFRETR